MHVAQAASEVTSAAIVRVRSAGHYLYGRIINTLLAIKPFRLAALLAACLQQVAKYIAFAQVSDYHLIG